MQALFRTVVTRIRGFLRPGDLDRDFDQELDAHLAMAEADKVRRGMTPEQARRVARAELGGLAQVREAGRDARGLPWLSGFWLDIKLGIRLLVKYRGLTLVSTFALAVATAIVAGLLWPLSLLRETFRAGADDIPFWFDIRFGWSTALLVVGLVLLSAVLTGFLPALKLTDGHKQSRLQHGRDGSSLRFGRAATLIVISQVALTVALLAVGGAQLRSFIEDWASLDEDPMAREEYLTAELRWDLGRSRVGGEPGTGDFARRAESWRALGRRIAQEPDVRGVTFHSSLGVRPFAAVELASAGGAAGAGWTYITAVEPNFFDVHGRPVHAGRAFHAGDLTDTGRRLAIVNEAFVRRVLPSRQAIGQRIDAVDPRTGRASGEPLEIVGVVGDFLMLGIATVILLMGLAGCGRPMRRALRIQPTEALRADD